MSREVHVRFCESRGVRFPPATHLNLPLTVRKEGVERNHVTTAHLAHVCPDKRFANVHFSPLTISTAQHGI
jgi:hypothetical protein